MLSRAACRAGFWACAMLLAAASAVPQSTPDPQLETGRQWLARCGEAISDEARMEGPGAANEPCLAWVQGLFDMDAIYRGLGALDRTDEGFCPPATATLPQAARAIVMYIEARQSAQDASARMLAYMALRDEFPCRR